MYKEERKAIIESKINEFKSISVKELSHEFNVSEVIIRKDLKELETEGKLLRVHGGAVKQRIMIANSSILSRKEISKREKQQIAIEASKNIGKKDVIFLETSSINILVAKELMKANFEGIVITNMLDIAFILKESSLLTLIITSGTYDCTLGAILSSNFHDEISLYSIDKAFIGTGGINIESGTLSNFNMIECFMKKALIEQSKECFILAESTKLNQDGRYHFSKLSQKLNLITDNQLDEQSKKKLESKINLIVGEV